MDLKKEVNPALAYMEGMLWAAYGVKVINCDAVEWQIDAVKETYRNCKQLAEDIEIWNDSSSQCSSFMKA